MAYFSGQGRVFIGARTSGGNPAGNASFTNPEFVVKRFIRVQSRIFVK